MKLIIVVLAVVVSALAVPFDLQESSWLNFKVTHGKTYTSPEEERLRLSIYKSNLEKIAEHNARYAAGQVSYYLKENQFADLTHSEFREMMLGMKQDLSKQVNRTNHQLYQMRHIKVDESKDWRQSGAVTPVKNQAQCGSCWAFSTTGSLESHQFLQKGKLVSLSEQNLVDCSGPQGNLGCSGGLMDAAFDYIIQNGGIDTESSYPYEAQDDVCRYNPNNVGARVKSYVDIPSGSEQALLEAVSSKGPVSIAIDASSFSFQLYGGGVYNEPYCSSYMLDHGVLAVGYGSDPEGDYWLVKNSWGASWGLSGYIKMTRDGSNQCGVATQAVYPIPA